MILGIDLAFIHTPHRALADWYADVLCLPKGCGDDSWQSFPVSEGSRLAIDCTASPRSLVDTFLDPNGNWMQLPQRKAVDEGR
jgi:hypothetical protein